MKKVLISLAAVAMLACMASCNKTCDCKLYVNGAVTTETEVELDKDSYDKCSDMNTIVTIADKKNGLECKSQLF
ncbi:MAG: hypothetical protein Q4D03_05330 [Bacteroidales bacterium]|nr:hypothetical protein [Bacteroidales bacterium]